MLSIPYISPWCSPAALPLAQQVSLSPSPFVLESRIPKHPHWGCPPGAWCCSTAYSACGGHSCTELATFHTVGYLLRGVLSRGIPRCKQRERSRCVLDRNRDGEVVFGGAGARLLCSSRALGNLHASSKKKVPACLCSRPGIDLSTRAYLMWHCPRSLHACGQVCRVVWPDMVFDPSACVVRRPNWVVGSKCVRGYSSSTCTDVLVALQEHTDQDEPWKLRRRVPSEKPQQHAWDRPSSPKLIIPTCVIRAMERPVPHGEKSKREWLCRLGTFYGSYICRLGRSKALKG